VRSNKRLGVAIALPLWCDAFTGQDFIWVCPAGNSLKARQPGIDVGKTNRNLVTALFDWIKEIAA
jgi:hypothetical protein